MENITRFEMIDSRVYIREMCESSDVYQIEKENENLYIKSKKVCENMLKKYYGGNIDLAMSSFDIYWEKEQP